MLNVLGKIILLLKRLYAKPPSDPIINCSLISKSSVCGSACSRCPCKILGLLKLISNSI